MFARRHRACQSCLHKIKQLYHQRHSSTADQWTSKQIRQQFVDFFCSKHGHQFVKSSSVIPRKDEGIYFTNAGMNQVFFSTYLFTDNALFSLLFLWFSMLYKYACTSLSLYLSPTTKKW